MKHTFIITKEMGGIATALFCGERAVELSVEEVQGESLLGNIYVGKIANVVKNIHAAFVEIEGGLSCYLDLEKCTSPILTSREETGRLAAGDELLVQVVRESTKTKAPTVTTQLSFSGKYLVLSLGKTGVSCSLKLEQAERERLKALLTDGELPSRIAQIPCGWIVRTNGGDAGEEELRREAAELADVCGRLLAQAKHRPCRSCLYRTGTEYLNRIRDLRQWELDEIVTDDPQIFEETHAWLSMHQPGDLGKLRQYQDRLLPLAKLYALESAFASAVKERVWLKSGGYLVIQPTEALTVIDVNTGKYDGSKKLADTFLKINLEAAQEAARQLRLRNLSGMVIIDFINMKKQGHRDEVMNALSAALQADPCKAVVVDMTPLGLVEVTRKRARRPLAEQLGRARVEELKKY